jgi:hypothetical protein
LCLCSAYPLKEGNIRGALIVEELAVCPRKAGLHGLPVLRAQTTEVLAENGKKIQDQLVVFTCCLFVETNSRVNVEKMLQAMLLLYVTCVKELSIHCKKV